MEALFTRDYWLLWMAALALALFLPVRRLIWVLYVRREQRRQGGLAVEEQERLKRRANVTAILICLTFAFLYTSYLFGRAP